MDFIKKNAKWIAIGACVLTIIGTFLSFATASINSTIYSLSNSVKFVDGSDGKLVIAVMIASAVLIYFKKYLISFFTTGVALGITLYDAFDVKDSFSSFGSLVKVNLGIGFYICLIGIIITGAATFICYKNKENK